MEILFRDKALNEFVVHMNAKSCFKTTRLYTDGKKETGFEVKLQSERIIFYDKDGFDFLGCSEDIYFK